MSSRGVDGSFVYYYIIDGETDVPFKGLLNVHTYSIHFWETVEKTSQFNSVKNLRADFFLQFGACFRTKRPLCSRL